MQEEEEKGILGGMAQDHRLPHSGTGAHQRDPRHTSHHCSYSGVGTVYCHRWTLGGRVCGS